MSGGASGRERRPAKQRNRRPGRGSVPLPVLRGPRERNELVLANERLVTYVAKRYWSVVDARGLDHDDVLQAGRLGLMRAAELYDESKAQFSTYACGWIRQAILRHIEREGWSDVPFSTAFGAFVTDPSARRCAPGDREPDDGAEVEHLLAALPERWALVLRLRYLEGLILDEVALRLGVSRERVRQLEVAALDRLRQRHPRRTA